MKGRQRAVFLAMAFGLMSMEQAAVSAHDATDVQLEIDIQRTPDSPREHYTLQCNPPGGTVANPAAACRRIAGVVAETTRLPAGESFPGSAGSRGTTMCTQIYGGPEVAFIRGRWLGAPADWRLSREDGCKISGYDATMKLLGIP